MSRLLALSLAAVGCLALAGSPSRAADPVDPSISGKKASEWVALLEKGDTPKEDRRKAASSLGGLGSRVPESAILALGNVLRKDKEAEVRLAAARSLRSCGPRSAPVIKALSDAAKEETDDQVRAISIMAIGRIRRDGKEDKIEVRYWSVVKDARTIIADALKAKHADVRAAAAETLGYYGADAADAVSALAEIVGKDEDTRTRCSAVVTLSRIGDKAHSSVPAMVEVFGKKESPQELREAILDVFAQFGPKASDAVTVLTAALKEDNLDLRRKSAVALSKIGPDAKPALPVLREIMTSSKTDKSLLCFVIRAVGSLGKEGKDAVPDLIKCLDDNNLEVRIAAIEELGSIGPDAKDAIPKLRGAALDARDTIKRAAQDAIQKIQAGS